MATAPTHATGRHRGDGGRPSGKSSNGKTTRKPVPGTQIHLAIHAAIAAAGRDRLLVTKA